MTICRMALRAGAWPTSWQSAWTRTATKTCAMARQMSPNCCSPAKPRRSSATFNKG